MKITTTVMEESKKTVTPMLEIGDIAQFKADNWSKGSIFVGKVAGILVKGEEVSYRLEGESHDSFFEKNLITHDLPEIMPKDMPADYNPE